MSSTPKPGFIFTGKHMAAIMATFFGVIIIVNSGMAYMALKSWTGLVVKNSYVASQEYNTRLETFRTQKQAGWNSKISYRNGVLKIAVLDNKGQPLTLDNSRLEFGRPVFEQQDQTRNLTTLTTGKFEIELKLQPGEWYLRILGTINAKPYRRDARLFVSKEGNGSLQ